MSTPGWSVERYKQIIDSVGSTVDDLRAKDRQRAAELAEEVVDAQEAAAAAARREQRISTLVENRWQSATKALWNQRWLTMKPFPEPSAAAGIDADLTEVEAEVERAHQVLVDEIDRPPLLRRRKRD